MKNIEAKTAIEYFTKKAKAFVTEFENHKQKCKNYPQNYECCIRQVNNLVILAEIAEELCGVNICVEHIPATNAPYDAGVLTVFVNKAKITNEEK